MRRNIFVIALGILVFITLSVTTGVVRDYLTSKKPFASLKEANQDAPWSGPKVGERVDLAGFNSKFGEDLASSSSKSKQFIILSLVDPNCKMSVASIDLVRDVRSFAKSKDIRAYIVSFNQKAADNFFDTQEEIFHTDDIYVSAPLETSLARMVVPSHLLIRNDGTVVSAFPGGSSDEQTRIAMAREIEEDVQREIRDQNR